jgi:hypothetical protein
MRYLTEEQMQLLAGSYDIEPAILKSLVNTFGSKSGFIENGNPVILFERDLMKQRLIKNKQYRTVLIMEMERPDLCNDQSGCYEDKEYQHSRLTVATTYNRVSALESTR